MHKGLVMANRIMLNSRAMWFLANQRPANVFYLNTIKKYAYTMSTFEECCNENCSLPLTPRNKLDMTHMITLHNGTLAF